MIDYKRIAKKIEKLNEVTKVTNVGFISETHPVNLYIETSKDIRLYISNDKFEGWSVDFTRDPFIRMRSHMATIHRIKNQTEAIKVIEKLINNEFFTLTFEGYVA